MSSTTSAAILGSLITRLHVRPLQGIALWQQFLVDAYPILLRAAQTVINQFSVRDRSHLNVSDVLGEMLLAVGKRFARKVEKEKKVGDGIFGNYRPEAGPLDRFLVGLVFHELKRTCHRLLKEDRKRKTVSLTDGLLNTLAETDPRTRGAEVMEAVNQLPDELRKVIVMHYLDGVDFRTIGDELGLGKSTVFDRKRKALRLLRIKLRGSL